MKHSDFERIMEIIAGFVHDMEMMNDTVDKQIISDRIIMILTNLCYDLHNNND